jgi:hypothetical protein
MRKKILKAMIFVVPLMWYGRAQAQLVATLQTPATGLTHKPQLWNMMLINPGPDAMSLQVQISLQDLQTGQKIITGTTRILQVARGAKMLQYGEVAPVQYNYVAAIPDKTPDGLLPVGLYRVCYTFIKDPDKNPEPVQEECVQVDIQPLSPPQLITPAHESVLETNYPQLNWLPPGPAQLFTNLRYDIKLVALQPNQTAAEAIQQNSPVYSKAGLTENYVAYPASAAALNTGTTYAWQVVAKDFGHYAAQTDIWTFTVKAPPTPDRNKSQMYNRLRKGNEPGYGQATEDLLFAYDNEAHDSAVTVQVFDISRQAPAIVKESIILSGGDNFITLPLKKHPGFTKGGRYRLVLINSRGEQWSLVFELLSY